MPQDFLLGLSKGSAKVAFDGSLTEIRDFETDINELLQRAVSSKSRIISVVTEDTLNIPQTVSRMTTAFNSELEKVKSHYKRELEVVKNNVENIVQKSWLGQGVIEMVKELSQHGWTLLLKDNKAFAYRHFNPPFQIFKARYSSGRVDTYRDKICDLCGIQVDLTATHIVGGVIKLITVGRHPNAEENGNACPGTIDGRKIEISNPETLRTLLVEIAETYKFAHPESAWSVAFQQSNEVTESKESSWK